MASLLDPRMCGFAKVAAFHVFKTSAAKVSRQPNEGTAKYKAKVCRKQYDDFLEIFDDRRSEFTVDYRQFMRKLPALKEKFLKWSGRRQKQKEEYLETFSVEKWTQMSNAKKFEHTFVNCKGCYHYHAEVCSYLISKSPSMQTAAKEIPFSVQKKSDLLQQAH